MIVDEVKQASNLFELVRDDGLDDRKMVLKNYKNPSWTFFSGYQLDGLGEWPHNEIFVWETGNKLAVVGAAFHPVPFAWICLVGEFLRILAEH